MESESAEHLILVTVRPPTGPEMTATLRADSPEDAAKLLKDPKAEGGIVEIGKRFAAGLEA